MCVLIIGTLKWEALAMRAFVRKHKNRTEVIVSVALLVALVEAWSVAAPMRGRMAARFDVRRRHYKVLAHGSVFTMGHTRCPVKELASSNEDFGTSWAKPGRSRESRSSLG